MPYANPDDRKANARRYYSSPEGKAYFAEYRASEQAAIAQARYRSSEKGKATRAETQRRYSATEKGKATDKRFNQSDKGKLYLRRTHIRNRFGLTAEEWDAIFESQGRVCGVCGKDHPGRRKHGWCTDHCHKTGAVRGILCLQCNAALGMVSDSVETLTKLISYLEAGGLAGVARC